MNASDDPSVPAHFPELPCLDTERVDMLRELCLDAGQDLLRDMLGSWATEAAQQLAQAERAMHDSDQRALKAAAHALKGCCGNMGAVRLAELGRVLEQKVAVPAEANAILDEMQAEFTRAREQLTKFTA